METCRNGTFISENLRTESESNGSDPSFGNLGPGPMWSVICEKAIIDMNRENDIGTWLKLSWNLDTGLGIRFDKIYSKNVISID